MRFSRLVQLAVLTAVALASVPCFGQVSRKIDAPAQSEFEVGKHYRVVVTEIDGDEAVTTIYWATVRNADEQHITLADGEWTQEMGPVVKPRSIIVLNGLSSAIERMLGRKPNQGRLRLGGIPMGEEIVVLSRATINRATAMSEAEFQERKDARRTVLPRPPHALVKNASSQ